MPYSPVVSVDIAINAVNLSQQGFGTPIFITSHNEFNERVRSYASLEEVGSDFDISHNAYQAATQFFKNSPSPAIIKIGRRGGEIQAIPSTPSTEADTTYTISVSSLTLGATNYTATTINDNIAITGREAVVTDLVSQLNAQLGFTEEFVAELRNTGDSAILVITSVDADITMSAISSATGGDGVEIPTFVNEFIGNEEPAVTYEKIKEYDSDFYFVTHEMRPTPENLPFLKNLATTIEAENRVYFVGSNLVADIGSLDVNESFFYWAFLNSLTHTVTFWHQAATTFIECYYVGYNAPYEAGTVTWSNLIVNGAAPSALVTNLSKPLTTTQLGQLMNRNANFIQRDAGVNVIRIGKVASGEWIDTIRGVHWLTEDMTTSLKTLLFNQKGTKVPYTNTGIAQIRETVTTSLQRAVNRTFLSSFTVSVPMIGQAGASYQEFVDRVLKNVSFVGILAGAIHMVEVKGQVTPPTA